jgi:membrane protease YdiL (CAAX protease family)
MKVWGYWATLGWAVLAYIAGQIAATVLVLWWQRGNLSSLLTAPYDGTLVALSVLVLNPVTVASVLVAVRIAKADPLEYLALLWPHPRDVATGIVCLIALIAATDALLYLSGTALVTPFQLQSYSTAATEGSLAAMLFAAIVVAPAGEEMLFRGFMFRGFVRPDRAAWPGIVATAVLFALPHVQYDWVGVLQIFVIGLFLGWMRWRSGSVLLTFLLHALFNLEGMIETFVQVHFIAG